MQNPDDADVHMISHTEALSMFDKCLTWLQNQEECTAYNYSLLQGFHDIAAQKRLLELRQSVP